MYHVKVAKFRWPRLRRQHLNLFEACLIGLVTGFSAVVLKHGVGWLGSLRVHASYQVSPWIALPLIGLTGGAIAGFIIQRFAPETYGSGIPQVKAVLSGHPMALNLRVAFAKIVGSITALGAGLTLGREGPTVQVGAALAAHLSKRGEKNHIHKRHLIAAGAGASLAAAFNAPIAGVLFVLEELLGDVSGFAIGTAIVASFVASVVARLMGVVSLDVDVSAGVRHAIISLPDIPFYMLLGVVAGILGGLFNRGILSSIKFNEKMIKGGPPVRIALAGAITGLAIAALPSAFRDYSSIREWIADGYCDLNVAFLSFAVFFALTLIGYGSGAPGGLFAPSLTLGSSLGYLIGLLEQHLIGSGSPHMFAMAGMGAFFAAVARVPITAVVIVFEMTTDFSLVLPLMVGVVVAVVVAEVISRDSIYDRLLVLSGIQLDEGDLRRRMLDKIVASDLMEETVRSIPVKATLGDARELFVKYKHRGFPVMKEGELKGIVCEADMNRVKDSSAEKPIESVMTKAPTSVHSTEQFTNIMDLFAEEKVSRLPVTEDGKVIGMITRSDVIRAVVRWFGKGSKAH